MAQQMFDVTDQLTISLIKTIPIKVVSWLQVMGKYVPEAADIDYEIAGIKIKISAAVNAESGAISIPDENISITWQGEFATGMHTFKVSNEAFTRGQADLAAVICLEQAFYDRLQSLQDSLQDEELAVVRKMADTAAELVNAREDA